MGRLTDDFYKKKNNYNYGCNNYIPDYNLIYNSNYNFNENKNPNISKVNNGYYSHPGIIGTSLNGIITSYGLHCYDGKNRYV
jgi:hypothetical protein